MLVIWIYSYQSPFRVEAMQGDNVHRQRARMNSFDAGLAHHVMQQTAREVNVVLEMPNHVTRPKQVVNVHRIVANHEVVPNAAWNTPAMRRARVFGEVDRQVRLSRERLAFQ